MITADTITDEQIRELRADTILRGDRRNDRETIAICDSALNPHCHAARKHEARARCAEILNARAVKP